MDYSTEKEGIKRRKIMSTEIFETLEPDGYFQPYAPANSSVRPSRGAPGNNPEVEGHFRNKSSTELDEQDIPAMQAFEVFMGKIYKPTLPEQTEYEISTEKGSRSKLESPLARFTRLSLELKELEEDLTLLATDAKNKKHRVMVDAGQEAEFSEVMQGLNTLQLNLSALDKNSAFQPYLRSDAVPSNADVALTLQKDLTAQFFKQIDALKRQQQGGAAASSSSDSAPVVYEVYSNGELNAVDRDAKARIAALEARISTLERAVGSFQGQELQMDGLSAPGRACNVNLTSSIAQLEQRVALMSEKNLDAVKTRTTALVHELKLLSKLKQSPSVQGALNSQADRDQIQKIYDQLGHLNAVAASVPTIVDRLVTLKSVHDEALDVTNRMDKMEQTQGLLSELLDSDMVLLANMEASLAENVQVFQTNIQQLDERMTKLLSSCGSH
ncbi:dynactin subunit 2 [Plasmopara halstedii]|uniref:Dynactin subunit 2 n=1 Tax=Plasmopara halstedii TaxID=4781 RepID=A0A0P1AAT3_PLAHL|nr:dynactin subunit 2 [Plasmopara halstedii]CEG37978.1 dynactin subunit 2 [Plasmopara halstedii]|eukprot:XP_024574347.1 dynactin subunit 2 [Plasmopara halstedii]